MNPNDPIVTLELSVHVVFNEARTLAKIVRRELDTDGKPYTTYLSRNGKWIRVMSGIEIPDECIFRVIP